jgi:hypothetical protein
VNDYEVSMSAKKFCEFQYEPPFIFQLALPNYQTLPAKL